MSGDLNSDDIGFTNNTENSRTVVKFYHADENTLLDGFTISGGNNDTTLGYGGGIYNDAFGIGQFSKPVLSRCTLKYNKAERGGAFYNYGTLGNASPVIENCNFSNNQATADGGALYSFPGTNGISKITLSNCDFTGNSATSAGSYGGAIYLAFLANAQITNCNFISNSAETGGALHHYIVNYAIADSSIYINCLFKNNLATGTAGAISFLAVNQSIHRSKFINCIFDANTTGTYGNGGAAQIQNQTTGQCDIKFINSKFYNNHAGNIGGAIFLYGFGSVASNANFTNCSFYGNNTTDPAKGSCFFNYAQTSNVTASLTNCIVYGNSNSTFNNYSGSGAASAVMNYCLYDNLVTGFTGTNNIAATSSPFQSLQLNLTSCSEAINSGNNSAPDLSGITKDLSDTARILAGTIDIGAYEYSGRSSLDITLSADTICPGTSATINILNSVVGNQYELRNNSTGVLISGPVTGNGATINLSSGTIDSTTVIKVVESGLCNGSSFAMEQPLTITTLEINRVTEVSNCGSGSISVSAFANAGNVQWYDSPVSSVVLQTGNIYTTGLINSTTTYYAETNNGTCSSLRVPVNAIINSIPVSVITSVTNLQCYGDSNGTSSITASNGLAPYSYEWLPYGGSTNSASSLMAGTYTCVITDANLCQQEQIVTINQPLKLEADVTSLTDINCNGKESGSVTIGLSGGTSAYSYYWLHNNEAALTLDSLNVGRYVFIAHDQNNCTATKVVDINTVIEIAANVVSKTDAACYGNNNGAVLLETYGGNGALSYSWLPVGGTAITASGLSAGTYTCTITDNVGCSISKTVEIMQPALITNSIAQTACDSYVLNSQTYTASGVYTQTLTASSGCDSVLTLNLVINGAGTYNQTIGLCTGQSITVGSHTYNASGTYTDVLTSYQGCDSIVITDLIVASQINTTQNINMCTGGSVTVGVHTYSVSGTYRDTLIASAGCDSIVTLNLIVSQPASSSITQTACGSYVLNLQTYNTSGVYTQTLTNAAGCDSVITLNLTINNAVTHNQTVGLCLGQSIAVGSNIYTTSGIYTDILTTSHGCDSTVITDLTVASQINNTQNISLCNGTILTVGLHTYSVSGTYKDTLTAAAGCDSIITSNLTIDNIDLTTTFNVQTITANQGGAVYQWIDCDNSNAAITGETNQSFTASANGNYAVVVTVGACTDTSACTSVTTTGISDKSIDDVVRVYPNPNNGQFIIELNSSAQIRITDILGRIVYSENLTQGKKNIAINNEVNGIYFMKVVLNDRQFVKQIIVTQ